MRRTLPLLAAIAAATLTLSGLAAASPSPIKLQLRHTSVGTILVDGRGFTVYAFTKDGRDADVCMRISGCTGVWPLRSARARPGAGQGVRASLIDTIAIGGGHRQVTYAGHPPYGYVADGGPGQTEYVGISEFGGRWPALDAAGGKVG